MPRQIAFALLLLCAWLFSTSSAVAAEPATAPAAQQQAVTETIALVVHTAKDCPVCKVWRESPSGLATANQLLQDWPQLKLVIIERHSLHGSEEEALYPPELLALFQERQGRYQLSPPTPTFELVRQGSVISRHAGLQGWTDGTLQEIRTLQSAARR